MEERSRSFNISLVNLKVREQRMEGRWYPKKSESWTFPDLKKKKLSSSSSSVWWAYKAEKIVSYEVLEVVRCYNMKCLIFYVRLYSGNYWSKIQILVGIAASMGSQTFNTNIYIYVKNIYIHIYMLVCVYGSLQWKGLEAMTPKIMNTPTAQILVPKYHYSL